MRALLLIIILAIASPLFPAEITCYSKDKVIYQGNYKTIYSDGTYFIVQRKNYVDLIHANCIVDYRKKGATRPKQ